MSKLADVRKDKGVTAVAVARLLGVSRTTYYRYERDPDRMKVGQAKCVADFLGCDVCELFFEPDVKPSLTS